jgi:hypothetical protein
VSFGGTDSKEKSHNYLKLLFLKRRKQFISKNITFSSGYIGYMFLESNSKLGPFFIAKLSVSEKILMVVNKFSSLLRVKNIYTINTVAATRRVTQLQRILKSN